MFELEFYSNRLAVSSTMRGDGSSTEQIQRICMRDILSVMALELRPDASMTMSLYTGPFIEEVKS